jgi:hypothetical protein
MYYKEIIASLMIIAAVLLVGCFSVVGAFEKQCNRRKK